MGLFGNLFGKKEGKAGKGCHSYVPEIAKLLTDNETVRKSENKFLTIAR